MRGRVRNWARLVKGEPKFNKDAPADADFSPLERELIARAACRVIEPAETDSPQPDNARTGATHSLDGQSTPGREIAPVRSLSERSPRRRRNGAQDGDRASSDTQRVQLER